VQGLDRLLAADEAGDGRGAGAGGVQAGDAERGDAGQRRAVQGGDVPLDQVCLADVRERQVAGRVHELDGAGFDPVPLENRIRLLPVPLRSSGGSGVFVDEAAQDGFSVDPLRIEAGGGGAGLLVCSVRDALVDALVRPGAVVVRLVLGQDRIDARGAQDLVDGRRRDRRAELG
jgi:hypothetical protein